MSWNHSTVCSCRRWELTGIPCKHACLAIWCREEDPESYVNEAYTVNKYIQVYEHVIMGINGSELWPKCNLPAPLPPKYENRPGRPKKLRRRQLDEPPASSSNQTKLKRSQKSLKCGKCGKLGHNARTCGKKNSNADADSTSQVTTSQPTAQHINEIPLTGPEPEPICVTAENSQPQSSTPSEISKLPVKRKRVSSTVGVNVGGSTNRISSLNVNQSSTVNAPFIVRGGVNYITMANLRHAIGTTSSTPTGGSSGKKPFNKESSGKGNEDKM